MDGTADIEFWVFKKQARGLSPSARVLLFEDYLGERIEAIWRAVGDRPISFNGSEFPVCLSPAGRAASVLVTFTSRVFESAFLPGVVHEFHSVDALAFDRGGVLFECSGASPAEARLALVATLRHEFLTTPRGRR